MSLLDAYAKHLATAKDAEAQAAALVEKVIKAAQVFGVPLGENWKNVVYPSKQINDSASGIAAARKAISDWPSMEDVEEKIRAYREAAAEAEAAYAALNPEQKAAVYAPTGNR